MDSPLRQPIISEGAAPGWGQSWARSRSSLLAGAAVVFLASYEAIKGHSGYLAVLLTVVGAAGLILLVVSAWSRSGRRRGVFWRGLVSFSENDLQSSPAFPHLVRTPRPSLGRRGLSGGRLEVQHDGIHWSAGSPLTPGSEITGQFVLPWTEVQAIDIGRASGKLPFLGGTLTISLAGEQVVRGEFLGQRRVLTQALRAATSA